MDLLIYFSCEARLSPCEVLERVQHLFPSFDPSNDSYSGMVTELFLDIYECNRGLGLTVDECASQLDISGNLMVRLLHGEGLNLTTFLKLARAERSALSRFKRTHLENIDKYATSEDKNAWKASVALLEKVLPSQYGVQFNLFNQAEPEKITEDMDEAVSAELYFSELKKLKR